MIVGEWYQTSRNESFTTVFFVEFFVLNRWLVDEKWFDWKYFGNLLE